MSIKALADRFIRTMKLDGQLLHINEGQYQQLYQLWRTHSPASPLIKSLPCGIHGFLRTDAEGKVVTAGVNAKDPMPRQRLAVVHEGIHAVFGGPQNQPNHQDLHVLAGGLAHTIFPNHADSRVPIMFDSEEMDILRRLQGDVDDVFDDDFDDEFDDEQGVVLADDDQYFLKGLRKKLRRRKGRRRARAMMAPSAGRNYVTAALPPSINVDNAAAAKILSQYRGWATPFLIKMFETGQVLVPTRGIYRVNNYSEWSGWTHGSLEDYWRALTTALDSTSLSKTAKIDSTRTISTAETTMTTGAPTYPQIPLAGSVRIIGLVVRIAVPGFPIARENVAAGTGYDIVGVPSAANIAVFADNSSRRRQFAIGIDPKAGGTIAEFLVLMTENDRGAATVVGQDLTTATTVTLGLTGVAGSGGMTGSTVTGALISGGTNINGQLSTLTASTTVNIATTDVVYAQLAGCSVTIESLNLRDIVGDSVRR